MFFEQDLLQMEIPQEVLSKISLDNIKKYHMMPFAWDGEILGVVTCAMANFKDFQKMERIIGCKFDLFLTEEHSLEKGINYHYKLATPFKIPVQLRLQTIEQTVENNVDDDDESKIVDATMTNIFNSIIRDAVMESASDIHLLPTKEFSIVQFRVNGKLEDHTLRYRVLPAIHPQIVVIIKTICKPELNASLTIVPQDGAFEIHEGGAWLDCRVSTQPGVFGEKIVIRLHNTSQALKSLGELGFVDSDRQVLAKLLDKPQGMILVTGPTSSGKTTTLYACLKSYDVSENIIFTIEDPVEIKVPGYIQTSIRRSEDEKLNLTFAKLLRAALRQDPDVILVGEIRDHETAKSAVEASQTGHIMLSTLHTRSAISTLSRMVNLQVDRQSLLSELICIIAQRLVQNNCPHCSVSYQLAEKEKSKLNDEELQRMLRGNLKKGKGCMKCNRRGYLGRTIVAEILVFDNETRDFFAQDRPIKETLEFLVEKKNFHSLWEKGLQLVEKGITTVEELTSIVDKSE